MTDKTRIPKRQLRDVFLLAPESSTANNIPIFQADNNPQIIDSGKTIDGIMYGPNSAEVGNIPAFISINGDVVTDTGINYEDICVRKENTSTIGNIPLYASDDGTTFEDSGKSADRVVLGPTTSTPGNVPVFDNTTGDIVVDSGIDYTDICLGPDTSTPGSIAVFNNSDGTLLADSGVSVSDLAGAVHTHDASEIVSGTLSGERGVEAGNSAVSFVTYNGLTPTPGMFYGGNTEPFGDVRLNYAGKFYATNLVTTDGTNKGDILTFSAANTLEKLHVGTDGQVLMVDSSKPTGIKWGDLNVETPYVLLSYKVPGSSSGGSAVAGGWYDRPINTEEEDTHDICTLDINPTAGTYRFTLVPGSYIFRAVAVFGDTENAILRLLNVSSNTVITEGLNVYFHVINFMGGEVSLITPVVDVPVTTTFALQYRVQNSKADNGLGESSSTLSTDNRFCYIEIYKIG